MGFKPCLGGAAEAFLLGGSEGLKGAFKAAFGAGLHFHENKGSLFLGHDVQLEVAGTPVAVEYLPAEAAEMFGGGFFSLRSCAGFGRAGKGGMLRGGRLFLPSGEAAQEAQHSQPCSCFLGGRTPWKSRRCRGQGPNLARASRCSLVP